MKIIVVLLAITVALLAVRTHAQEDQLPPTPAGQTWKLVWQDEFDGDKLDSTKWEVPDHKRRDGWWSPKAVALDGDGHLAISTLKDGDRYLDACVRTQGKFEHAHGYYVARIKLQNQPGHWSAFWLYNSSVGKIGDAFVDEGCKSRIERRALRSRYDHKTGGGKQLAQIAQMPRRDTAGAGDDSAHAAFPMPVRGAGQRWPTAGCARTPRTSWKQSSRHRTASGG